MWHLNKEANAMALEDSINKLNAAMFSAATRSSKGKGKVKER
jgi:hypothetical protein